MSMVIDGELIPGFTPNKRTEYICSAEKRCKVRHCVHKWPHSRKASCDEGCDEFPGAVCTCKDEKRNYSRQQDYDAGEAGRYKLVKTSKKGRT